MLFPSGALIQPEYACQTDCISAMIVDLLRIFSELYIVLNLVFRHESGSYLLQNLVRIRFLLPIGGEKKKNHNVNHSSVTLRHTSAA